MLAFSVKETTKTRHFFLFLNLIHTHLYINRLLIYTFNISVSLLIYIVTMLRSNVFLLRNGNLYLIYTFQIKSSLI